MELQDRIRAGWGCRQDSSWEKEETRSLPAKTSGVVSKEKGVPGTMERPLLILTLAFAAGIATGVYMRFPAGPLLIAAAFVFAMLFGLWRVGNLRENARDGPGWLLAGGLLLLVFLAGMAYVTVRQYAAQGTVPALSFLLLLPPV